MKTPWRSNPKYVKKSNGTPINPGARKTIDQWCKNKTRIILTSRGFTLSAFLNGEPFDRHQDDTLCVVSLLMSQGYSRDDAVLCMLNMATLIAQGHPRMRKIWTIGKESVSTSVINAQEIVDLCSQWCHTHKQQTAHLPCNRGGNDT